MKRIWWVGLLVLFLPGRAVAGAELALSCENVESVISKQYVGQWRVALRLTPQAARDFERLTAAHVGEELTLLAGGKALWRETVFSAVPGGAITLRQDSEAAAIATARAICEANMVHRAPGPVEPSPLVLHPELVLSPGVPVACFDVAAMELWQFPDFLWGRDQPGQVLLMLIIHWTPDAGAALTRFLTTVEETTMQTTDGPTAVRHVQLLAQGQRIRSDAPNLDGFSDEAVVLVWRTQAAALAAARLICPNKVPTAMQVPRTFGAEAVPLAGGAE